jgi:hypothetical protein
VVAREAGVHASQAEKTLGRYKDGDTCKRATLDCWGCNGNHSWMCKGKIVCPHGSDPQVVKKADKRYAAFKEARAKWGDRPKGKTKKEKVVEYNNLNKRSKKKI